MPAFFPRCAKFVEDGANFLNGYNINRLMEISTDGHIKCNKHSDGSSCCNRLQCVHEDMVVEIKCPFPSERNLPVHYSFPDVMCSKFSVK